jgi:Rad3-related DNA helicase
MDIKSKIQELVEKIQKDPQLRAAFKENPIKAVETLLGVDLPDDLLSGAAIVSTGIPMVNPESEMLRELYDDGMEGGYDAAYTYPGFRRVLQAAGRVIRTETDRGVVLLLDARYGSEKYLNLMPPHWNLRKFTSMSKLNAALKAFWKTEN